MTIENKQAVGVVGPIKSGKSTGANYLERVHHFSKYALSDRIREDVRQRAKKGGWSFDGLPEKDKRRILQNRGDELRARYGPAILAERTLELIKKEKPALIVIESIRLPEEVGLIREELDAFILGISASPEMRHRLYLLSLGGEEITFEQFSAMDGRELAGKGAHEMKVGKALEAADFVILNEGTVADLERTIYGTLKVRGILKG